MGEESIDLIAAAARGDRDAAGRYFAQNLPLLAALSRRIAGGVIDPDDLLSDAILSVLAKWAQGGGPTEYVNAYVAQAMRNRVKDELKSPRSRVQHLEDAGDQPAEPDPQIRRADIQRELGLVRRAMSLLPEDQRAVLTATVVDGRKPRELEGQLGRPSASIYSLSRRARINLRRTMLKLLLEKDAPPECRVAAQRLPETVGESPEFNGRTSAAEHYRTCRRCRGVWARFASISTVLGISALAVVGDLVFVAPVPAEAASDTDADADAQSPSPASAAPAALGQVASAAALPASNGASAAWWATAAGSRRLIVLAAALLTAGLATVAVVVYALVTQQLWFTPEPTAQFHVAAQEISATSTAFAVDFDVDDNPWSVSSLQMSFSEEIEAITPPEGWRCESTESVATCTTSLENAEGGVFTIEHPSDVALDDYLFMVTAETDVGAEIVGRVSSGVRPGDSPR